MLRPDRSGLAVSVVRAKVRRLRSKCGLICGRCRLQLASEWGGGLAFEVLSQLVNKPDAVGEA